MKSTQLRIFSEIAIIEGGTAKIILAHNHPSQNKKPSNTDIKLTNRLVEAGRVLDIPIIDHLIVTTNKGYCSVFLIR